MKMRNVETITHTTFSLKPFILYLITKTVRFNYIQFSQANITRNTSVEKKITLWPPVLRFALSSIHQRAWRDLMQATLLTEWQCSLLNLLKIWVQHGKTIPGNLLLTVKMIIQQNEEISEVLAKQDLWGHCGRICRSPPPYGLPSGR